MRDVAFRYYGAGAACDAMSAVKPPAQVAAGLLVESAFSCADLWQHSHGSAAFSVHRQAVNGLSFSL